MKLKLFNLLTCFLVIIFASSSSALFMACCCEPAQDPYTNKCEANSDHSGVECKKACKPGYTSYDDPDGTNEDPICCKGAKDHTGTLNEECCKKAGGGVRTVNGVKKCCRQSSQNS